MILNKRRVQAAAAMALAVIFSLSPPAQSEALADGEEYTAVDGNQIEEERLLDQLIEYEELGSLIHSNNKTIQNLSSSTKRQEEAYTQIRDSLRTDKSDAKWKKEEAEDSGDLAGYAEYASWESVYSSAANSYNQMVKKLGKYSTNRSRITLEKELTKGAQSLMVSCRSLTLQKELLEGMERLYKKQYEDMTARNRAGLATVQEVSAAYNQWQDAVISLASLEDNGDSLYRSLCLMLGVDDSGSMEIGTVPRADKNKIAELDLEEDTKQAIINNTSVLQERNTSAGSSSAKNKKKRTVEELEEKVKSKMQELYDTVYQSVKACQAAETGYAGAQNSWETAQRKFSLGMLSTADYIREEIQYTNKKAELEAAELVLWQALENYRWAARGIVDLDE